MSKLGHQLNQELLILRRPWLTEKTTGTYIFEVAKSATKPLVRQAVQKLYGVRPRRVNIINLPAKRIVVRGRLGTQSGMKKAVVTLKAGDKINLA